MTLPYVKWNKEFAISRKMMVCSCEPSQSWNHAKFVGCCTRILYSVRTLTRKWFFFILYIYFVPNTPKRCLQANKIPPPSYEKWSIFKHILIYLMEIFADSKFIGICINLSWFPVPLRCQPNIFHVTPILTWWNYDRSQNCSPRNVFVI